MTKLELTRPTATDEPFVASLEHAHTRLTAELGPEGTWRRLAEHRVRHARPPKPHGRPDFALIDRIERSGLRGRGGAGYPTARKLRAVAERPGPRVVVANATEGEPASGKDALLGTRAPHLILDGALLAAAAVGAAEVIVCVDRTNTRAGRALSQALSERLRLEAPGCSVQIAFSPPRYVAGEETALVHWLNGGPSKPTLAPPRPFEKGVGRRPTLVQNVETLCHLAQISSYGPQWFRQAGTHEEPGTALFTVSGAVAQPSVIEAGLGSRAADVLAVAGAADVSAVLVGGFFGTWVTAADLMSAELSRESLGRLDASPGAGILVVLPHFACGIAETARLMRWYAGESAGQCGPCAFGLPALAAVTDDLARGVAGDADLTRLHRWAGEIEGRGACRHPDGAVRLLRSALTVFGEDAAHHHRGRPCAGSEYAFLKVPEPKTVWK